MSDPASSVELFTEYDSDEIRLFSLCGVEVALCSRAAPERETPNEDAAVIIPVGPDAAVFAVADGCGGLRGGSQASQLAVNTLAETVQQRCQDPGQLRSGILDALELASSKIIDLGIGAATTMAVVSYHAGMIRSVHAGDSMILLIGRNGSIKSQTVAHSPVGFALESGLIDEEAAIYHEERHLISNVLGDPEMSIELGPSLRLAKHDTVLIASDGLFDNLFLDEISDRIRKGSLRDSLAMVVQAAWSRMQITESGAPHKPDDLTVIAVRRKNS